MVHAINMVFEAAKPRIGLAGANMKRHSHMHKQVLQVRASSSCSGSGALYEKPASGVTVDSAGTTTFQWNPSCLDNSGNNIDIYLYAPQQPTANLPIHAWTQIPAKQGSFDVKLAPMWWNATQSVQLSLNIVPTGNQPWDTANPFGPTWTAIYNAPTDGSKPPADAVVGGSENKLVQIFLKNGQITPGGKAAAIICPLLVFFIGLGILIRKLHINRNNKTADWADHMDKRMSQISMDWTAGGDGSAGPVPGSRPASFMSRPQSSYRPSLDHVRAMYNANLTNASTSQTNLAGMGAAGEMSETGSHGPTTDSMIRQSQYRGSRISFAPSTEMGTTNHGHTPRSHKNSASIPRIGVNSGYRGSSRRDSSFHVPKIDPRYRNNSQMVDAEETDDALMMSPTQEQGAHPVNMDRLRRSIDDDVRNSMLAYPALEMVTQDGADQFANARPISGMSMGADSAYVPDAMVQEDDESNAHSSNHSVTMTQETQMQTGMLPPTNAASPDEALRQYAAQRSAGPSPMPMSNNTMRTLYSTAASPQPSASPVDATRRGSSIYIDAPTGGHRTQQSLEAPSTINEDDVVGYNEMIDENRR